MHSWLRLATAIVAVTVIGSGLPALAQKSGGILKMYDPDSPPTMSILEEATIGSQAPMMGCLQQPPAVRSACAAKQAGHDPARSGDRL